MQMDARENDSSSIHLGQSIMNQYFNKKMYENEFQYPLQKEDDHLSLREINSLNASQQQVHVELEPKQRRFDQYINEIKSYNLDIISPSSSLQGQRRERDFLHQEEQSKLTEPKMATRQGIDETIQSSQLAILNQNQVYKERLFFDGSQKEKNSVEEKSKKNSINSPMTHLKKQQNDGEASNTPGVRFEDQLKQNDTNNHSQNPTLKLMIHQNKVNNIKKKFINSLIRTCPSAIFKYLTRKQFNILNDQSSDFGYFIHGEQQLIYSEVIFNFSEINCMHELTEITQTA